MMMIVVVGYDDDDDDDQIMTMTMTTINKVYYCICFVPFIFHVIYHSLG